MLVLYRPIDLQWIAAPVGVFFVRKLQKEIFEVFFAISEKTVG